MSAIANEHKELSYTSKQIHMHIHIHRHKKHIQSATIYSHVWPDQDFWSQCHIWNPREQLQSVLLDDSMGHFLLLCVMKKNDQPSSHYLFWNGLMIMIIFWFLVENVITGPSSEKWHTSLWWRMPDLSNHFVRLCKLTFICRCLSAMPHISKFNQESMHSIKCPS